MALVNHFDERDCTDNCKSMEHGDIICAALTKREVSDEDLCAYINRVCCRCEAVRDHSGRKAIHIATSCGRLKVVKWLIRLKQANINVKDYESGYTPLHRSIFYGRIDVAAYLIKHGASTTSVDYNGLNGLELAMKDSKLKSALPTLDKLEVYVWGSNTNYVFGSQQGRSLPELLDSFHKENPQTYIKQVCLEKFHCVLVASNGQVYACGHGYGGRLGLSSEETCMSPKLIKFTPRIKKDSGPVYCSKASINIDHSVFLSTSGYVWTCGLNTHCVLGINPPPPQVLEPYQLKHFKTQILGICAGRYHTVAWCSESIFTWGLNGGQLGLNHINDKYVVVPKMVLTLFKPQMIAVSNCATAVLNTYGNICVFYGYVMVKIAAKVRSITNITVVGGRCLNTYDTGISEENNDLRVIGLNKNGSVFIWYETNPLLLLCLFTINRSLNIVQITSNLNEILLVTRNGEAFRGTVKYVKEKTNEILQGQKKMAYDFLGSENCHTAKVIKIPNVHRAVYITSDIEGKNFVVLQAIPSALLEVPQVSPSIMNDDMLKLFHTPENESLQNLTIKVRDRIFHMHQFIIATSSQKFYTLIKNKSNQFIEFSNTNPDDFEQIILYLYTQGYMTSEINKLLRDANILKVDADEIAYIDEEFKELARLNAIIIDVDKTKDKQQIQKFSFTSFPELHDVILKSKDNKLIHVHGCILIARSEYFSNCFSIRWNENSKNQEILMPFTYNTLIHLIEYLYTDELPSLLSTDLDQVCNLLIAADHMCISRLKEICECTLCLFVTLKNVGYVLAFASNYYAEKLKHYCMEFVSLNLAALLETRALDYLSDALLLDLSNFYCKYNDVMQYRVITPSSAAPTDEEVVLAGKLYSIVLEDSDDNDDNKAKSPPKSQKRRSRQRKSSSSDINQQSKGNLSGEHNSEIELESSSSSSIPSTVPTGSIVNVPSRIKAIISAHDAINCDNISETYTTLKSTRVNISLDEFPTLSKDTNTLRHPKSPKGTEKVELKQKITKVSQKEQKRLSSIAESNIPESPVSESPKNPWKQVPNMVSPEKIVPVHSIIVEEKRQKENFVKMKFKHLVHIQIEDKAIEDLYKFYNADSVFDEIITIVRVPIGAVATPQWSHTNKKN